jgi:hypothetical protein
MAAGLSPFRIEVYETQVSDFGRGPFRAIIEDASDVGCSSYANDIGEVFFTIPMNHPQIDRIEPLASHIEVKRLDTSAQTYSSVWMGVLDDYDATTDEVVFYGHDYLGLLAKSIVPQATSATSAQIGLIINNTWTARKAETNSPVDFISTGSIATTSRTVTITAPFEEQLSFYAGLCDILAGAGTTRPMVYTSLAYPPSFNFSANRGVDTDAYPRIFMGGQILDFRYSPGLTELRTRNNGIGVKREGATVLYSSQTVGSPSTYGDLEMANIYTDIINQAELDSKTLADARNSYFRSQRLYISLAQGHTKPLQTGNISWDLGDDIGITIQRGIVDIDDAIHTIWGWEWIGRSDGSESLFLDVQPKMT